jgi:hypothetical protein
MNFSGNSMMAGRSGGSASGSPGCGSRIPGSRCFFDTGDFGIQEGEPDGEWEKLRL